MHPPLKLTSVSPIDFVKGAGVLNLSPRSEWGRLPPAPRVSICWEAQHESGVAAHLTAQGQLPAGAYAMPSDMNIVPLMPCGTGTRAIAGDDRAKMAINEIIFTQILLIFAFIYLL